MAISKAEAVALVNAFHDTTMITKGNAAEQGRFFLHPAPWIIIPHGEDISLQTNYEIHQKLTDEKHTAVKDWDVTPLCDAPERARIVGAVFWEGRLVASTMGATIKCCVGEDWIVQRVPSGELKIALYINTFHHFLPDSAPMALK